MRVEASGVVNAPADVVYKILADYRNHHPNILPKPYFTSIEVEQGGIGAGTVVTTHMTVYGQKFYYHLHVTEPEPGRVLMEKDDGTDITTTFTVVPGVQPNQSQVTIATTWEGKKGMAGLMERLVQTSVMRRIYQEELKCLVEYALKQSPNH